MVDFSLVTYRGNSFVITFGPDENHDRFPERKRRPRVVPQETRTLSSEYLEGFGDPVAVSPPPPLESTLLFSTGWVRSPYCDPDSVLPVVGTP